MSVEIKPRKALKSSHPRPRVPTISLSEPGRLRVAHLMSLVACSHSAIYSRINKGFIPKPDGEDPRPYWHNATIRPLLEPPQTAKP